MTTPECIRLSVVDVGYSSAPLGGPTPRPVGCLGLPSPLTCWTADSSFCRASICWSPPEDASARLRTFAVRAQTHERATRQARSARKRHKHATRMHAVRREARGRTEARERQAQSRRSRSLRFGTPLHHKKKYDDQDRGQRTKRHAGCGAAATGTAVPSPVYDDRPWLEALTTAETQIRRTTTNRARCCSARTALSSCCLSASVSAAALFASSARVASAAAATCRSSSTEAFASSTALDRSASSRSLAAASSACV